MYKKTITYEDFDGNQRTEDFYFNLTKAELFELNFKYPGGLANHLRRIQSTQDYARLCAIFKEVIALAYGEKDETGRRFVKSKELFDSFSQTNAYSILYMDLATNSAAAAEFINGIVPADLAAAASAAGTPNIEVLSGAN